MIKNLVTYKDTSQAATEVIGYDPAELNKLTEDLFKSSDKTSIPNIKTEEADPFVSSFGAKTITERPTDNFISKLFKKLPKIPEVAPQYQEDLDEIQQAFGEPAWSPEDKARVDAAFPEIVKEIGKSFIKSGATIGEIFSEGVAGFSQNLDNMADIAAKLTNTKKGGVFEQATKQWKHNAEFFKKIAGKKDFATQLTGDIIGGAIPGMTDFMLGPVWAFLRGAADKRVVNNPTKAAMNGTKEAAKWFLMKSMLDKTGILNRPLRMAGMGAVGAAAAAGETRDIHEIIKNAAAMAGFGIHGEGRMGIKELYESGANVLIVPKKSIELEKTKFSEQKPKKEIKTTEKQPIKETSIAYTKKDLTVPAVKDQKTGKIERGTDVGPLKNTGKHVATLSQEWRKLEVGKEKVERGFIVKDKEGNEVFISAKDVVKKYKLSDKAREQLERRAEKEKAKLEKKQEKEQKQFEELKTIGKKKLTSEQQNKINKLIKGLKKQAHALAGESVEAEDLYQTGIETLIKEAKKNPEKFLQKDNTYWHRVAGNKMQEFVREQQGKGMKKPAAVRYSGKVNTVSYEEETNTAGKTKEEVRLGETIIPEEQAPVETDFNKLPLERKIKIRAQQIKNEIKKQEQERKKETKEIIVKPKKKLTKKEKGEKLVKETQAALERLTENKPRKLTKKDKKKVGIKPEQRSKQHKKQESVEDKILVKPKTKRKKTVPKETKQQKQAIKDTDAIPEKVEAVAVRSTKGTLYEGLTREDALHKMRLAGENLDPKNAFLYVTNKRNIYDHAEIEKLTGLHTNNTVEYIGRTLNEKVRAFTPKENNILGKAAEDVASGKNPLNNELGSSEIVKDTANWLYNAYQTIKGKLSVESQVAKLKAFHTVAAFKNYFSTKTYWQERGLQEIQEFLKLMKENIGKLTIENLADVTLAYEDTVYRETLDPEYLKKLQPGIDWLENFFKRMEKEYNNHGIKINFKERMSNELLERIKNSEDPEEVERLQNRYNRLQEINYLHIPIRLLAAEKFEQKLAANKKRRSSKEYIRARAALKAIGKLEIERKRRAISLSDIIKQAAQAGPKKAAKIQEKIAELEKRYEKASKKEQVKLEPQIEKLYQQFEEAIAQEPTLTKEDVNPIDIIMNYMYRMSKDMASLEIRDGLINDDLLISDRAKAKKKTGWEYLGNSYGAGLAGHIIKGEVKYFLDNLMVLEGKQNAWDKAVAVVKMSAFYNPLFLPMYDGIQSIMSGIFLNPKVIIKAPINLPKAFYHVYKHTPEYMDYLRRGLYSKPFDYPFNKYKRSAQLLKDVINAGGGNSRILKSLIEAGLITKDLKSGSLIGAMYNASWNLAWFLDEVVRTFTARSLEAKGMPIDQAVRVAAKFHGDYANVPPKTRKWLNRFFFTPTFKIAMGNLYYNMIKQTLMAYNWNKKTPAEKQLVMGLLSTVAINIAFDNIITSMGWERDKHMKSAFARKYMKTIYTHRGPREITLTFSGPPNLIQRYAQRVAYIAQNSDGNLMQNAWKFIGPELTPMYGTFFQWATGKTRTGKEIFNKYDDRYIKILKQLGFFATNTIKILGLGEDFDIIPDTYIFTTKGMSKKEAEQYFLKNKTILAQAASQFMLHLLSANTRTPEAIRFKNKLKRMKRQFKQGQKLYFQEEYKINYNWLKNYKKAIDEEIRRHNAQR